MRISTQAASQSALMDLMRAQREAFDARTQLSTGRKAQDIKGYGNAVETILAGRGAQARAETFITSNKRLEGRLAVQDLAYQELSESVTDLRNALTTLDGSFLISEIRESFNRAVNALNTRFSGSFVFGGVRTDTLPVNAATLADLQNAAPDISAVFDNAQRRQSVLLDDNIEIDLNHTAAEVGADLMDVFRRIADFNDGPDGPFDGPLTETQKTFIQAELANVNASFEQINQAMGENGARQSRVETAISSHRTRSDFLQSMLADLEDADMAQAAVRLTQAQTAVEVSARTFAALSQVSLLNFLR